MKTTPAGNGIRNPQPFYELFEREPLPYSPPIRYRRGERWMSTLRSATEGDYYPHQTTALDHHGAIVTTLDGPMVGFSGYDYLSLILHPHIERESIAALRKLGTGTGGVRLLTGTNILHRRLEERLATWLGTESAVVVTSGFMANLATAGAVIGHDGYVIADELTHRSMTDGLHMIGVPFVTFRHNDLADLERLLQANADKDRVFIVTEGIFSMSGDLPPLPGMVDLKKRYGAYLVVDEAHSLGVLGRHGRGAVEHFGVDPRDVDVITGSLSKTVPSNGGFIATNLDIAAVIQHEASAYLFSAALDPVSTQAALTATDIIEQDLGRRERLHHNVRVLRTALRDEGYDVADIPSPIIPVLIGVAVDAYKVAVELGRRGMLVSPVGFPAVPRNKAILRLCVNAAHTEQMLRQLAAEIRIVHEQTVHDRATIVAR